MINNSGYGFRLRYAFAILILYILVSIPLYLHTNEMLYINMIWNVILAFLPLLFANLLLHRFKKLRLILKPILVVLWLAFFPNAPYMVTDFIHISGYGFYLNQEEYSQLILSTNMTLWIRIVYIGIGMLMGTLSGLLSLRIVHQILRQKFDSLFSWFILLIVFLFTGYGIFLGRFLRLNSWNIVHPHQLLLKIASSASIFSVKFTILYAFFVGVIYLVFCIFCPIGGVKVTNEKK
jgi:uncharacterized membrane protein